MAREWGSGTAAAVAVGEEWMMGARILVVDDETPIRELFTEWLGVAGHTCLEAGSAEEALELADDEPADVALLDLCMPGEDGVWLARRLRERQQDIAIILATGSQSFDAAVEGMRLGILDYLVKPFSRQDLLAAVARGVSVCEQTARDRKERERLEQEVEQRSAALCDAFVKVREASAGTLEALLVTLHSRNPEAFDHTKRVADMATTLATAMGLEEPLLSQIECAALLHDIGKVAMPDSMIHKPGKLTEEEQRIIRTHPQIGHDILAAVPSLRPVAEMVLASHEWYDGGGYPRGLRGNDIPIGARIVTVADAYDALTHPRVYRSAVSAQAAAAELGRCAGHQFDPAVVRAWLRLSGLSLGPRAHRTAPSWRPTCEAASLAAEH